MKATQSKNIAEYGEEPNSILYLLICKLFGIGLKLKYRLNIKNEGIKGMKPPFIVLGNHASNFDPFIMTYAMLPHKINLLGTNYYFRNPTLRPLLKALGVIPKIQFYRDTRAVRMMSRVITRGGILGIFPEGRRSIDGSLSEMNDAIAKLIKLYRVPVVALVSNGAYLSRPRWSSFNRKGIIEVNLKRILDSDEIEKLSLEEIQSIVSDSIYFNDYEWNRIRKISFNHKRIAERIDLILHECPSCGGIKSMMSKNNRLYCRVCGNSAFMNEYGFMEPENDKSVIFEDTVKWYGWQMKRMLERVREKDFSISSRVRELRTADGFTGSFSGSGRGDIVLKREGLTFRGIVNDEPKEMFFPINVLSSISSEFGASIEITDGKNTWCFFLEDGQEVVLYELAVSQLMHSIKES